MWRVDHPERGKNAGRCGIVDVKPQEGLRPEDEDADVRRLALRRRRQSEDSAKLLSEAVPADDDQQGPKESRPEERAWLRKERDKHVGASFRWANWHDV